MRKVLLFLIGGIMCFNLTILTTQVNPSDLSISKIKSALASNSEDGPDDRSNYINDPYDCVAIGPDGTNLLEGYTGNDCIKVLVCPECYCYIVSCD